MESFDTTALLEQVGGLVTTWGLRVVGALAVLVLGRAVARRLRRAACRVMERRQADPALIPFLSGIVCWGSVLLDYWQVRWDVTRSVKEALDAAGCSIPFPQRDVHLSRADGSAA